LLGLVTVLPIAYFVFFLAYVAPRMSAVMRVPPARAQDTWAFLNTIGYVHVGAIVLTFALLTFYVVFLYRTERVPASRKALWAVIVLGGSIVAMPIFWFLYVWRQPLEERAGPPSERRAV